jgi:hypothetical protein
MKQRKHNVIKWYQNVKAFRVKRKRISLENSKLDGKNCYADEPRSIPQKISHFVG